MDWRMRFLATLVYRGAMGHVYSKGREEISFATAVEAQYDKERRKGPLVDIQNLSRVGEKR
jgi:hypothetical protein